eukprot:12932500-Prorocentrum_lima.AAC.1
MQQNVKQLTDEVVHKENNSNTGYVSQVVPRRDRLAGSRATCQKRTSRIDRQGEVQRAQGPVQPGE